MRIAFLNISIIAALLASAPAHAQTYDPSYPVCIQVYGSDGGFIECSFNSMAQCAASAAGRSAQCITNPFYGASRSPAGRPPRDTN